MQSNNCKKVQNYVIHLDKPLGQGCFGKVYKAQDLNDKSVEIAVKAISMSRIAEDEKLKELVLREISVLRSIQGEHIVRLRDIYQTPNNLYLFMDYCDGGSLQKKIDQEGILNEKEACSIIKQIAKGFVDLEKLDITNNEKKKVIIMHRDIKPDNIMFHQGKVKITDFGFAKAIEEVDKDILLKHTSLGTPLYCPFQILKRKPYGPKCDVWSTGVMFYQLLQGDFPWKGSTISELGEIIRLKSLTFRKQIKPEIQDLITKMLRLEETDRISWIEVYNDPALN